VLVHTYCKSYGFADRVPSTGTEQGILCTVYQHVAHQTSLANLGLVRTTAFSLHTQVQNTVHFIVISHITIRFFLQWWPPSLLPHCAASSYWPPFKLSLQQMSPQDVLSGVPQLSWMAKLVILEIVSKALKTLEE
jgi:hypothetical protein